jgi:hypothetical protein
MKKGLLLGLIVLAGCTATQIENGAAAVQSACAKILPLANLAIMIPTVGPFVAAGVQVGCGTADGIARLVGEPSSAEWLAQQEAILKNALGK